MADGDAAARPRLFIAEWRDLALLNYEIDPAVLLPRVPRGCELDTWSGRCFVSIVGFRFLRTRVLGIPIPFHRNFDEVNLRFYVRRRACDGWRRGVVFILELVPRRAIAWLARRAYHENYVALPMRHARSLAEEPGPCRVAYQWRQSGSWEGFSLDFSGSPYVPPDDSEETFITEHYWGYAAQPDGGALEVRVEHPRWGVWRADRASLDADLSRLVGAEFAECLSAPPRTAFVAEGSPVVVRKGSRLE